MIKRKLFTSFTIFLLISICVTASYAEIGESERRYIRIGSLQSHFTSYGSERAWNNVYYEGLRWPADYQLQDNSVIKRAWIAVSDFTDAKGNYWEKWGTYISKGYVKNSLYPVKLEQITKFESPIVFVDGNNLTAAFSEDVDDINPLQIADRIITNVVNSSCGLTMTRRIYVFSQQYHDNYFIKEFTFTNTGFVDYDSVVVLNDSLKGVRVGWSTRYACSREGAHAADGQQGWGKHTWVTVRGEDYPNHVNDVLTESNGLVDWIRGAISWFGQSELVSYDNIGAPYLTRSGRLTSPHFVGTAILHVDQSAIDSADNPYQPAVLGWHAGDTYPSVGDLKPTDALKMVQLYGFLSGTPYGSGMGGTAVIGTGDNSGRMWENVTGSDICSTIDPYTIHGDGGGTNQWINYGPFDLAPGESITFVEVEGVNGINRQICETVGRNWKEANWNQNEIFPFDMPDGSTISGKYVDGVADTYKNTWVYTGIDSILLTFSRAKRNYDSGFNIPQPPQPPAMFSVESAGDRIKLTWAPSPDDINSDFAGYKIFRAVGKPDTLHQEIADLPKGTTSFDDVSPVRGFSYYYYIQAYNDGSNNTDGVMNPVGSLYSSRFFTKTTEPAYLQRQSGTSLKDVRVVPNPYNISAKYMQYPQEQDKLMFLNIPGKCDIKIYSERGDLIEIIKHRDGTGDETWNSITSSRQVIVSGIYIAYIEVTEDIYDQSSGDLIFQKGDNTTRKIIIVR